MKFNWKPMPRGNKYSSRYQPLGNQSINQHYKDKFPTLDDILIELALSKSLKIPWKNRKFKIFKTSRKYNLLNKAGFARTVAVGAWQYMGTNS